MIPATAYPVTPFVITVASPFSFESTKGVPWNYESTIYIFGQKV
jgi:hypothetical protein